MKASLLSIGLLLCLFSSGCAEKKPQSAKRITLPPSQTTRPTTPIEETVEGADSTETVKQPPSPRQKRKPTVALVFGGVGTASWATVGVLKRFEESEIKIKCVVATGWPAMFALGYGFFRSIHDLEWFSRRLKQSDFYQSGFLDFSKGYHDQSELKATLKKAFRGKKALGETRVPVVISASYPQEKTPSAYRSGPWINPVLKAMSTPGIYRPLRTSKSRKQVNWSHSLVGLDIEEAQKCQADFVIAFDMYSDYLSWLHASGEGKKDSESVFRQLYVGQFRKAVRSEKKDATYSEDFVEKSSPLDFKKTLGAMRTGYRRAGGVIEQINRTPLP